MSADDRDIVDVPLAPPSSRTLQRREAAQRSDLEKRMRWLAHSPIPALALSAVNLGALSAARKAARGYPTIIQCTWYTGIFAAASYCIQTGDTINGSGLVSGWSAIWMFFNARKALRSRKPVPISIAATVAAIGTIYGYEYFTFARE
ncbi:hypothetical protein GGF46_005230 [Coemansia sp. RSA 552]|nr:hypothetical protein GGF46_005230 [Coemansia sp. RSA 552]